jgi:hypothetical protein
MKLTRFEANLMRLHWVAMRLEVLYNGFYKVKGWGKDEGWFKAAIREYVVIQLNNFIKIRRSLLNNSEKIKQIDKCLEPLWNPIFKHEKAIRELRNSYLAHMQEKEPFETFIEDITIKYGFPNTFGETLFMAGCTYHYFYYLTRIFKKDYDIAIKKYRILMPVITEYGIIRVSTVSTALSKVQKQVEQNLKDYSA